MHYTATVTKVKEAQPMGAYQRTETDDRKDDAEFRLISVGPYFIRWKDGRLEKVTERKLKTLQASHSWAPDF